MKKLLHGITIIELSLVIMIGAMVIYGISISTSGYFKKLAVDETTDDLIILIQTARRNSLNSTEGKTWGLCKSSNKMYTFVDNCDSTGKRQSFAISPLVSISGLNETRFTKLKGEPNPSNNLSNILVQSGNYSKKIKVNRLGGVSVTVK